MGEPFSESALYLLHLLVDKLDRFAAEDILPSANLTFSEFLLLTMIYEAPGCNHDHLARRLTLSPASISLRVKSLVASDFLVRRQNPANRKEVFLDFTEKGKEVFTRAAEILQKEFDGLFVALGPDQGLFVRSLKTMLTLLDGKELV